MSNYYNRQWRLPNAWNGTESNVNKQSNFSLSFDGFNDFIDTNFNGLNGLSKATISIWAKTSNILNGDFIYGNRDSGNNGLACQTWTDGKIYFYVVGGYNLYFDMTSAGIQDNQWFNLVFVFNGSESINTNKVKIYVNKNLIAYTTNTTFPTTLAISSKSFKIGNDEQANAYWTGNLDAVSIFNYALSQSQINTLYGSSSTGIGNPQSITPKPVAFYPLGDQDAFNGASYLVPNASLQDYVFDFDVSNDYIDCGNDSSLNIYNNITISAWIKADSFGAYNLIIGRSTDKDYDLGVYSTASGGAMRFHTGDGTQENVVSTGTFLNTGVWYHVAVTRTTSPNQAIFFINGQQLNTAALALTPTGSTDITRIGSRSGSYVFNGKLSNAQVFSTALPATGSNSVETLYNNGSPLTSMSGFTSLQGWWKLNATATFDGSNWTIPDDSSNSNTGTSNGMTQSALQQSDLQHTSGYSPYALQLDGTSNFIDCGATVQQPTTNYSVSCWVKLDSSVLSGLVGNFKTGVNPQVGFALTLSSGLNFQFWADGSASSSGGTVTGTSTPNSSTWYNVVGTYNGSLVKIYVNNVLENSVSYSATPNATDQNLVIGRWYGNYSDYYTAGSMSNVSVWNTALTSAQVTELYNSGVPSNLNNHSAVSSLISWWQLGSNSSFNSNSWTVLDEKGTNDGVSSTNMSEVDIVNGVGYSSNGVSSGMSDNVIGDAPYSTANSLSVNMDVLDRTTDIPS